MPENRAVLAGRSWTERSGGPVGHVLLTQRAPADVVAYTAAWVQRGLDENEWVLVVEPDRSLRAAAARTGLRGAVDGWADHVNSGRLAVLPAGAVFADGASGARRHSLMDPSIIERALVAGYGGVRMVVQAAPPGRVVSEDGEWLAYEHAIEDLSRTHQLSVLCQYHDVTEDLLLASAELHAGGVVETTVEITNRGGMTLLAGEVDLSNAGVVESALRASSQLAGDVLVLDVAELEFLCVAGCRALERATDPLRHRGGRVAVHGLRRPVRRVLELLEVHNTCGFELE